MTVAGIFHATIVGDRRVQQLLTEMIDRVSGVEPAWPGVGDVIAENLAEQFATEGAHLTGAWAPLSPAYLAQKLADGFPATKLLRTGAMASSFTSRPMAIEEYGARTARFGSDDAKAQFHQAGTSKMPQRQIINVTPDMADDVSSVLARYIFEDRLG